MRSKRLTREELSAALEELTGHRFRDLELMQRALTHSSVQGGAAHYEQLEFLGDRVLGLVIAEMLVSKYPEAKEGELAVRLSSLVSGETCALIAEESGLSALIRTDSGVMAVKGAKAKNVRADAVESLIAALYLEGGLVSVRPFVEKYWTALLETGVNAHREPKTVLQEWALRMGGRLPVYTIESRHGPDHDPTFTISVEVEGYEPATGTAGAKRKAEQAAAAAILMREGVWNEGEGAA